MVCKEELIEDGKYVECYICSIPVHVVSALKNYLTFLTSPSVGNNLFDITELFFKEGKDEYRIKSNSIEEDYADDEGLIQRRIVGYNYCLILPFYHMVSRPGVVEFLHKEYEPWGVTLNLSKEDLIEFIRTLTYLHIN